jgi:hypothetical protein
MSFIKSTDYQCILAEEFEVLVDPKPQSGHAPVIGLMITPVNGDPFIIPMTYDAAKAVSDCTLKTLRREAPQLFKS